MQFATQFCGEVFTFMCMFTTGSDAIAKKVNLLAKKVTELNSLAPKRLRLVRNTLSQMRLLVNMATNSASTQCNFLVKSTTQCASEAMGTR